MVRLQLLSLVLDSTRNSLLSFLVVFFFFPSLASLPAPICVSLICSLIHVGVPVMAPPPITQPLCLSRERRAPEALRFIPQMLEETGRDRAQHS